MAMLCTFYVSATESYALVEGPHWVATFPITEPERVNNLEKAGVPSFSKSLAQINEIKTALNGGAATSPGAGVTETRVKELIAASRVTP